MRTSVLSALGALLALIFAAQPAWATWWAFGPWSDAVGVDAVNDTGGGGCPIETPDGLSLMFASGRTGGQGLDIWVADRAAIDASWGVPANVPPPVSAPGRDFCPTPVGRTLYMVSDRDPAAEDACGGDDMFVTRQSPEGGWSPVLRLACAPLGPNFPGDERSPAYVETRFGTYLFYSSTGYGGDSDIYVSKLGAMGFGPGRKVHGVNTPDNDIMPNVGVSERGLLEMVFSSDRMSWGRKDDRIAFGGQDVYVSYGWSPRGRWTRPRNLGPGINTGMNEQRATLSGDRRRLYFGREGIVLVSERDRR